MSIVCVAIIGKDNDPLYIRTWLDHVDIPAPLPGQIAADPSLKFHYHVHTSIDVVEEKGLTPPHPPYPSTLPSLSYALPYPLLSSLIFSCWLSPSLLSVINHKRAGGGGGAPIDLYLGQLFAVEDYKVFGYITNSKIKFIVVIQDTAGDVNLRQVPRSAPRSCRTLRATRPPLSPIRCG